MKNKPDEAIYGRYKDIENLGSDIAFDAAIKYKSSFKEVTNVVDDEDEGIQAPLEFFKHEEEKCDFEVINANQRQWASSVASSQYAEWEVVSDAKP